MLCLSSDLLIFAIAPLLFSLPISFLPWEKKFFFKKNVSDQINALLFLYIGCGFWIIKKISPLSHYRIEMNFKGKERRRGRNNRDPGLEGGLSLKCLQGHLRKAPLVVIKSWDAHLGRVAGELRQVSGPREGGMLKPLLTGWSKAALSHQSVRSGKRRGPCSLCWVLETRVQYRIGKGFQFRNSWGMPLNSFQLWKREQVLVTEPALPEMLLKEAGPRWGQGSILVA